MKRWVVIGLMAVLVIGGVSWGLYRKFHQPGGISGNQTQLSSKNNVFAKNLSRGKCQGTGTVTFSRAPMNLDDIGNIQPYGIMVGAHVIPTSHGYFGPAEFQSERDKYPVYAIADGYVVSYSHRSESIGDGPKSAHDEYQLWFEHSCTFYTYYDLLTSVEPSLLKQLGGPLGGFDNKYTRVAVKAGQLVGRVGGQTVDFGVWNFDKAPAYFANPKSYEDDRPYLEDMYKFFPEPVKGQLEAKSARRVEPKSGRVDYDIAGKLVGGWFKDGTGGFMGPPGIQGQAGGRYWDGHLAIVYDYIDPTSIKFSIGNWQGEATQFGVVGNTPDPKDVTVSTGLVKYELQPGSYTDGDTGQSWNFQKIIAQPKFSLNGSVAGTALVQLVADDKLKLELFPGKTAAQVTGFTPAVQIYSR